MKRIPAVLALSLLAAVGAARADEIAAYPQDARNPGTASVLVRSTAAGQADASGVGDLAAYPVLVDQGTSKSRADVAAEVEQARRAGTLLTNEAGLPLHGMPAAGGHTFAGRAVKPAL